MKTGKGTVGGLGGNDDLPVKDGYERKVEVHESVHKFV